MIVQGFDAHPVPCQEDRSGIAFPDRKSEHPVEVTDAVGSPGMIGLENDLGIAAGEKTVAESEKFVLQLGVVVHCAVIHYAQTELAVDHGLLGVLGQIDDLEAAVAGGDSSLGIYSPGIGAPGLHSTGHFFDGLHVRRCIVKSDLAAYPTHYCIFPSGS